MSNGIASLVSSLVLVFLFGFAGCARDRATHVGGAGTHHHASVIAAQPPASADGSRVIDHKLCPVMGEPLGTMGSPVPVTVGGETLFVCCRGCVKKVMADPAKYFAIARNE